MPRAEMKDMLLEIKTLREKVEDMAGHIHRLENSKQTTNQGASGMDY